MNLKEAHMSRALVTPRCTMSSAPASAPGTAEEVMRSAIYRRGLAIGRQFAADGPADLEGLRDSFLDFVPDKGRLFQPEVRRCDSEGLDINFHACPLKEA